MVEFKRRWSNNTCVFANAGFRFSDNASKGFNQYQKSLEDSCRFICGLNIENFNV